MNIDVDSWLRTEFEQNFIQMRDRDDKIINITKFYITLIAGIISACVALLGLKKLTSPYYWVGLLLIFTSIIGELIFFWIIVFRKYFVKCARQVNSLRGFYSEKLAKYIKKDIIINPTDASYPKLINKKSSHTIIFTIMTFVNSSLIAVGIWGVMSKFISIKNTHKIAISSLSFLIIVILNYLHLYLLSKEEK